MIALIFDYLGTIAFAISGALVGMQRRMDIFGIAILALATAVGGGMIRDTLVGNTPPSALEDGSYIAISLVTVVALLFSFRGCAATTNTDAIPSTCTTLPIPLAWLLLQ